MRQHHTANGLASLGRHGDTMLVHMSPQEVQGLESIARMQGTKLTRNPETGMPEAFKLGNFFKSLLPTVAGMGISAMFPGASPWLIGTLAGVGTTLATGNPLAGIMTGLGVGGGMGIGKGIFNIGDKLPAVAGQEVAESVATNELAKQGAAYTAGQGISPFVNNPSMVAQQASTAAALPSYTNQLGAFNNPAFNTATMQAPTSAVIGQNVDTFTRGLGESFSNPSKLIDEVGGMKLATPLVGATANAIEPKDYLGYDPYAPQPERKKIDITQPLNLNYDTGLKLYAAGGSITAGGINNLYGTRDDQSIQQANLSQDGFGLGRLNALGNEQSMDQAKVYGYAEGGLTSMAKGGYLDGAGDGMSDSIPATIEGKQPARLADGEFVVPADVVSHIGNGSSKAGSKRLYAMLHKVRKARTGNPKQGKQINPNKYMPA